MNSSPLDNLIPDPQADFNVHHDKNLYFPFPAPSTGEISFNSSYSFRIYDVAVTPEQFKIRATREFPNTSVLITELDNQIQAGDVKIRLSDVLEDEYREYLRDPEGYRGSPDTGKQVPDSQESNNDLPF